VSVEVLKSGITDSIQDNGRYGYQHVGIPTNGAMDNWAMRVANVLVNNPQDYPVVEMSFPACRLKFHAPAIIALTGADFNPLLNGHAIPLWQPVQVIAGSVLEFSRHRSGSFCYLAVHGGFKADTWLGSSSTSIVVKRGGLNGRLMQAGDLVELNTNLLALPEIRVLPFRAKTDDFYLSGAAKCLPGGDMKRIPGETVRRFTREKFIINPQSNRMGYRIQAVKPLPAPQAGTLSGAVTFGTIQLLPNGELIALMADHQTTGGYPVLACIAQAFRSAFVQHRPGDAVFFDWIELSEARRLFALQVRAMHQLEASVRFRFKEFLR
jgi:antagonist of KipI